MHVLLFDFVRQFWFDTIANLSASEWSIIELRLSSANTSGLGFRQISGMAFIHYLEIFNEKDYEAIVQISPFILYDLIPHDFYNAWLSLCSLIPLIRQEEISNINLYMVRVSSFLIYYHEQLISHQDRLRDAMNHFIRYVTQFYPKWLKKPVFHHFLHLPQYIRQFGPLGLFTSTRFEKHRELIREIGASTDSYNFSSDVAKAFANLNRIRHFLSGGKFKLAHDTKAKTGTGGNSCFQIEAPPIDCYRGVGPAPASQVK